MKNAQQVLRAFRHNTAVRRKVTRGILQQAIEFYIPEGHGARASLLGQLSALPEDAAPMEVEEDTGAGEGKGEAEGEGETAAKQLELKPRTTVLPEIELFDRFTLDDGALAGVLSAARELGMDAIWLDAWCYRFEGNYNHDDFCGATYI